MLSSLLILMSYLQKQQYYNATLSKLEENLSIGK